MLSKTCSSFLSITKVVTIQYKEFLVNKIWTLRSRRKRCTLKYLVRILLIVKNWKNIWKAHPVQNPFCNQITNFWKMLEQNSTMLMMKLTVISNWVAAIKAVEEGAVVARKHQRDLIRSVSIITAIIIMDLQVSINQVTKRAPNWIIHQGEAAIDKKLAPSTKT